MALWQKPWSWMTEDERERYRKIYRDLGRQRIEEIGSLRIACEGVLRALQVMEPHEDEAHAELVECFKEGWRARRREQMNTPGEYESYGTW